MTSTTSFTDLPEADQLLGDEIIAVVQPGNATSGVTKRTTIAQLRGNQSGRQQLTAATTFYLASNGSFSNTGLSTDDPWPGDDLTTVQQRISILYDFAGYDCNISFAAGTYTDVSSPVNWGSYQFLGCTSVSIKSNGNDATTVILDSSHVLQYPLIPNLGFDGVTVKGTLTAQGQSQMLVNNVHFRTPSGGVCGLYANFGNIAWFGTTNVYGPGTFTMTANGGILQLQMDSVFACDDVISPSVAFGVSQDRGMIYAFSVNWSTISGGSFVGKRFDCKTGSLMDIGLGAGYTYFPGTVNGTIASGGTYIG